ncbi:SDR family NAD(P)-dependent oxidoreductase [Chitinilyticum litopenaei]|uniref:SDR family NAD(P)-dependent oxidoreductase n=1 Tax=Chitinilyticum litopenaei TaxID=1121276 RepID=UPI00048AC9B2|nr:SDR family NAD(P)-dependent oxidoreductase [Chitinilyticum litopenaei]
MQKTVLITGGTRGIGAALVRLCLAQGHAVLATGSSASSVAAAASNLPGVAWLVCDFSDPASLPALAGQIGQRPLDLVIHNAGVQQARSWFAAEPEPIAVETELRINFTAPVLLTRLLFDNVAQRNGTWVFVSSGLAIAPKQSAPVYCASKAALRSFCKSLRGQALVHGSAIRVCEAILPMVDTGMTAGRGRGKISAAQAAAEIYRGAQAGHAEIRVGKVRWLMRLRAVLPQVVENLMLKA